MTSSRLRLSELHWPLIGLAATVALLGVYNLHSAAAARDPNLFVTQLGWMGLAGALVVISMFADYRITESLAYPLYGVTCVLLAACVVQGHVAKGAARWLALGPFTFQPSQLAKLATVLCVAHYFSQRNVAEGYSVRALVRPLNPSRPIAAVLALAVFWGNAWLADPIGELARLLHTKLGTSVPAPGNLLWFRALLVLALIVFIGVTILGIIRWEQRMALLAPWPRTRRRRLIILTGLVGVALAVGLTFIWNIPFVRDPFGVGIAYLARAGAPDGQFATVHPGLLFRLALAAAIALYLGASLWSLRAGVANFVDVLVAPIDVVMLPAMLILVQPDLGTAGIVILVGMTMVLVVGVRLRSLVIMAIFGALVSGVGWFGVLKDYQKRRILTFIDPEHDAQGAGWNAMQSMIAVGSGGWVGKGHKGGTQTQLSFLPEQHTDFAFSVWAEEEGFLGCALLLVVYFFLIVLALSVAAEARDRYGALLATGCAAIVMWQGLINVAMVIGVFPVVGITLPLFSYGGSSVLTITLAIGMLLNVHWRRRVH